MSLELVDAWTRAGWLRPLDRALVEFCARDVPDVDPAALLGIALVSHQLGRGHSCLDLAAVLANPARVLGLPPEDAEPPSPPVPTPDEALAGLTVARWRKALEPFCGDCAPLTQFDTRLYLHRYFGVESYLADRLRARCTLARPLPDGINEPLDRLFGTQPPGEIDWQRVAAALSLASPLTIVSGGPGTGKTTTVARLVALHQERAERPLRIALAAPTGKAAARLQESVGEAVSILREERRCDESVLAHLALRTTTIHRLIGARPDTRRMRHHAGNPLHLDLVVVDEASMVDLELMAALVDALPAEARLVLVGDKDQLASVEPGAVLSELCEGSETPGYEATLRDWLAREAGVTGIAPGTGSTLANHTVLLARSHRFGADSGIGRLARAINAGDVAAVRDVTASDAPDVHTATFDDADDPAIIALLADGYRAYLERLHAGERDPRVLLDAFNAFRVLCPPHRGPWGVDAFNRRMEALLEVTDAARRGDGWYPGRPVMITRNDRALGLYNGDVGITLDDPEHGRRVWFDGPDGTPRPLLPSRLHATATVWAMTVHKSQGSEFERVALVLPDRPGPLVTRELLYTGVTRARGRLDLVCGSAETLDTAVTRRTYRASGLAARLREHEERRACD